MKQHLIDPEICIRCHSCEAACQTGAIEHDARNVVVEASKCNHCLDCVPVCPTGSIDNWRFVDKPYALTEQYGWDELPKQDASLAGETAVEAVDESVSALLADAHKGTGGKARAPASAAKPTVNLYNLAKPVEATVQGNFRITAATSEIDVRHIILDLGAVRFPVLEGQSIGIIPPGVDKNGKPHLPRLYSIASPRDGERAGFNNLSLTVKREGEGIGSNYLCNLKQGDKVKVTGPFGSTFLLPSDPEARLLMVCTGTGSAPFRGFTMRKQRENPAAEGRLTLVFGARTPEDLPYFGPLAKIPEKFMRKIFAFSRLADQPKHYVQDELRKHAAHVKDVIAHPKAHIYICGKRAMEQGVDEAFADIARAEGKDWAALKKAMREDGRYHVETY